jgi:hypothetical protein
MVIGHVLFKGSPAEVMYQHQHAPLPLEQLEGVPQPAIVLLKVFLKKDPARRFQNPGELLKATPDCHEVAEQTRSQDNKRYVPSEPEAADYPTGKAHYRECRMNRKVLSL